MRRILISLCAVFFSASAYATAPSDESIDALLTAMRAERTTETVFDNMHQLMRQAMGTATRGKTLSEEQQQILDAREARFAEVMRDEFSWTRMRPMYVQIYRESFTDEEIAGLIAFYNSPAGVAFIEKMPLGMQKSMTIMQSRMGPMLERMQVAVRQAVEEAKVAK